MQELVDKVNKLERSYPVDIAISGLICRNDAVGDQRQKNFRDWLSAPDPWVNHNIAREAHHLGTATWFTQGVTMNNWKSNGSLMWIHGLRSYISFVCYAIVDSLFYG